MKNLLENGTRCLIVQTNFSTYSFWNYIKVCKIAGAKYPAAPLGLLTAAALLPQQWLFKLIDMNVEPLTTGHIEWADIVCIGGMLPQQQGMVALIDRVHRSGIPVVIGGPDPTSQPDLYQSADYIVKGEGEVTIPMFIEDLGKGCTGGEYHSDKLADMSEAVVPRFDLIRFKDYLHVGIQYSRGCPFNCEFCDIIELYGRGSRTKTPEQVLQELQTLYDLGYRGHVDFVDDNFIGNKKNVKTILPVIREWSAANKYPFYFSTESSLNLSDDENLMQMMKDIDFRFVFIGIETPDDKILELTNKRINKNRSVAKAVNKITSYGMIVNAGFIVGFDNETDQSCMAIINCIQESGICMAMVGKLFALPNTQLTRRLQREGRLLKTGSRLDNSFTDLDQTTSGLNFITTRPRIDVLRDYDKIIRTIYDPQHYYERILQTGLNLRPAMKHKPAMMKIVKNIKVFLKLSMKVGCNRITGWLYWKMLIKVIWHNPKALEATINLAAMFIHFHDQSRFILNLTGNEIKNLEQDREQQFSTLIIRQNEDLVQSFKTREVAEEKRAI